MAPVTDLVLGLDAGNSKTAAVVATEAGHVVGFGRDGCGDIYGADTVDHAVDAVVIAIREALARAEASEDQISAAACRIAGVDWPEDAEFWAKALAERLPGLRVTSILNDGFAPIRCGAPDGVGVAVVAGTGPAIAARSADGRQWAGSFWINDSLGGGGLGEQAFRAVCLAEIGIEPPTRLTGDLLELYGFDTVEALLHGFTRHDDRLDSRLHPRAARVVVAAAEAGDGVAQAIIRRQAERLADYAMAAARQVGISDEPDIPVVLGGSILLAEVSPTRRLLIEALAQRLPSARPVISSLPSVFGATLDAIAEAGGAPNRETVAVMAASVQDFSFLAT